MISIDEILNHRISDSAINKSLYELYDSQWDNYLSNIQGNEDAAYPYLTVASDRFAAAYKKVILYGQETMSWGGEFYDHPEHGSLKNTMSLYDIFVNEREGYNSPYWNFINSLKRQAESNVGFIVSNIVRIGKKYEAGCDETINSLAMKYFDVARQEYEILNPDIMLFLTGPGYDDRIKATFGGFTLEPISENYSTRAFAKIIFEDNTLPPGYRCYHPGYIQRIGGTQEYINEILNLIKHGKQLP